MVLSIYQELTSKSETITRLFRVQCYCRMRDGRLSGSHNKWRSQSVVLTNKFDTLRRSHLHNSPLLYFNNNSFPMLEKIVWRYLEKGIVG